MLAGTLHAVYNLSDFPTPRRFQGNSWYKRRHVLRTKSKVLHSWLDHRYIAPNVPTRGRWDRTQRQVYQRSAGLAKNVGFVLQDMSLEKPLVLEEMCADPETQTGFEQALTRRRYLLKQPPKEDGHAYGKMKSSWSSIFKLHGHSGKQMLSRMDLRSPIDSSSAFQQALRQVHLHAKNTLSRSERYTPQQTCRLPDSVISDDNMSSRALTESKTPEGERLLKNLQVREQASILGGEQLFGLSQSPSATDEALSPKLGKGGLRPLLEKAQWQPEKGDGR